MKFYKNIYLSEGYKKKKEELIRKMKEKKYPLSAYILVLIQDGENQLEFYPTVQLYQGYIHTEDMFVIGLAESYWDAMYLVESITKDALAETGTADIRSFINMQQMESTEIEE